MRTLAMISALVFITGMQVHAQTERPKRNLIRIPGVFMDITLGGENSSSGSLNNVITTGYTAGYERLIGSRVSVGFTFMKFFNLDNNGVYYGGPEPQAIPGYRFEQGDYSRTGFGLGYESRYYFGDFDEDGVNSGFLGFGYQYFAYTESMKNAKYYPNNWGNPDILKDFDDQTYAVNRFGLKFGYAGANALLSEFYVGVYYNAPGQMNKNWVSRASVAPLSINLGWTLGIPFR